MEQLKVISHPEFGNIRTEMVKGDPWFMAKDVCEAFGDNNYRRTISNLDEDEKGVSHLDTAGGKQQATIVNESGFYHLLFMYQPQKGTNRDIADKRVAFLRKFRKWVTSEVLPSIRRTGEYRVKVDAPQLEWYNNELCVRAGWLIASGVVSKANYQIMCCRGILKRERRSCQNRPALVRWESLPERFRNRIHAEHWPIAPPHLPMSKEVLAQVMADVCMIEDREVRIRLMKNLYQ